MIDEFNFDMSEIIKKEQEVIHKINEEIKEYRVNLIGHSELLNSIEPEIFYIVHIDSLSSIIDNDILSHNLAHSLFPDSILDISNQAVNTRRNKIVYRKNLHDYVPFYFNPRNAMLYKVQKDIKNKAIILGLNFLNIIDYIMDKEILFLYTNGNSSRQDTRFSNTFYSFNPLNIPFYRIFTRRRWRYHDDTMDNRYIEDSALKSKMMSEFLVYERVPFSLVTTIYVQKKELFGYIKEIIKSKPTKDKFKNLRLISAPTYFFWAIIIIDYLIIDYFGNNYDWI